MISLTSLYKPPSTKLIFFALILVTTVGCIIYAIEDSYLNNYSYFYDPVYYSFYNARLQVSLEDNSKLTVALEELKDNSRHPFRTIPLILFSPSLLASNKGHLATALPMLFVFLFLLGWTVHIRSGSLSYAMACMLLFFALRGIFDPRNGLPAYWLDLPAAFLVGAAALCLINSGEARNLKWFVAFSIFASLATLSRYIAAAYTLIICAPVLSYYLVKRYKEEGTFLKAILLPLGIISCTIFILAGYFIIAHYKANVQFYSSYGYALNQSFLDSVSHTPYLIAQFIGKKNILIILCIICIGNLIISRKDLCRQREAMFISLWYVLAVPFFLIFILRVSTAYHAMLYAVPLIFFVSVSPLPNSKKSSGNKPYRLFSAIIIVIGIFLGSWSAYSNYSDANHPSPRVIEQKELEVALANLLSKEGEKIVWNAYFDEYSWIPSMEAYYRYRQLPMPAGQTFFNAHESAWQADYPGISLDEINKRIYRATLKWVDIALILDDIDMIEKNSWMTNSYSRSVAKYMSNHIRIDPNWRRIFQFTSKKYGLITGYRNRTSQGRGYQLLLNKDPRVRP